MNRFLRVTFLFRLRVTPEASSLAARSLRSAPQECRRRQDPYAKEQHIHEKLVYGVKMMKNAAIGVSGSFGSPSSVSTVVVSDEFQNQRLDNFLKSRLKGVPKSCVYRLIRTGQVRVNKKRVKPSYHLACGDVIRLPPLRLSPTTSKVRSIPPSFLKLIKESVLYEDKDVLVLNKPSGLAVHGGSGLPYGLIEVVRSFDNPSIELVHRLDRDTSGCLLFARKRSILKILHEALRQGKIEKVYVALIKGVQTQKEKRVELPLFKNQLSSGERMVRVQEGGKLSSTTFIPIDFYREATLVEAIPHTGRTHQIRVLASAIGQPIAGDEKYGDKLFNQKMRARGLKRLFLHARQIVFQLPGNKIVKVNAPLPKELRECLSQLKNPSNF